MIQKLRIVGVTEIQSPICRALAVSGRMKAPALLFVGFSVLTVAIVGCVLFARQLRPGTTFRDCDECPEMIVIPAGTFLMGGTFFQSYPRHSVSIGSGFAVSKDMITRAEYAEFLDATGYSTDKSWSETRVEQRAQLPAIYVSWEDAQAYVSWLSRKTQHRYRLLSEAEYEYAERSGTATAYWWGDDPTRICSYVSAHECHHDGPTTVGSHLPNAFGLDDMTGNEFEWVEDCWHWSYDGAPEDGTAWTNQGCGVHVMRGCAWFVDSAHMRSDYRNFSDAGNRSEVIGFRVARDL
jgi:formylglycine-generating enzyme required for sulfatase activity